jgi:hypothetical protein
VPAKPCVNKVHEVRTILGRRCEFRRPLQLVVTFLGPRQCRLDRDRRAIKDILALM